MKSQLLFVLLAVYLATALAQSDKVVLDFYTESLCPDCINFFVNSFSQALNTDRFTEICQYTVWPYGNAKEQQQGDQWVFTCQHGEQECYGNLMETCAINKLPSDQVYPFILCLETEIERGFNVDYSASHCEKSLSLNLTTTRECMNSQEGNNLEHQVALKTESLNPQHTYVPWITVNGVHNTTAENAIISNMVQYVCQTYTGSVQIPACQQYTKQKNDDRVILDFYTESMCPDCIRFILGSLKQAVYTDDFTQICKYTIWPYGNAQETQQGSQWVFTCQHGQNECYGNLMETCAINKLDPEMVFPFIVCLEDEVNQGFTFDYSAQLCATQLQIDLSTTKACIASTEGNQLEHAVAVQTESLQPPHTYVPWITVSGQHNTTAENLIIDNMVQYVCQNYQGSVQIAACSTYTK